MTQLSQIAPGATLASQIITAQDGTTATSISLLPKAEVIKISSIGNTVLIKFGSAPTTTNFDDFVVNGSSEYIAIPTNAINVQFLATTTGATTRVSIVQK